MNKIAIVGTGHVGLVTGVCLSEIGHNITCFDIDQNIISALNAGITPFYESGLEPLLKKNFEEGRLVFTTDPQLALSKADIIYIAVGTPALPNGDVNLSFIESAARIIGEHANNENLIVVTKSTVPVGTNRMISEIIQENKDFEIRLVSNPEFLREGSAIYDTFSGDRIVIGADCEKAASIIEEINKPFGVPIFKTDLNSAEMIKYTSNAFLATKISFINEIANLCEKIGANVEEVALGMGLDTRIGTQFLKAGIGFGGSCFPKDTYALLRTAEAEGENLQLLESVLNVNKGQQERLIEKAKQRFNSLKGKKAALLGLAFKPNTNDTRESNALVIANALIREGARVDAYDPAAVETARKSLGNDIHNANSIEEALTGADMVFIATDWDEFKDLPLGIYEQFMDQPIIFDGRNCYSLEMVSKYNIEYYSIGRQDQTNQNFKLK
jgi:UDPglucose 6-dehydrogenase